MRFPLLWAPRSGYPPASAVSKTLHPYQNSANNKSALISQVVDSLASITSLPPIEAFTPSSEPTIITRQNNKKTLPPPSPGPTSSLLQSYLSPSLSLPPPIPHHNPSAYIASHLHLTPHHLPIYQRNKIPPPAYLDSLLEQSEQANNKP